MVQYEEPHRSMNGLGRVMKHTVLYQNRFQPFVCCYLWPLLPQPCASAVPNIGCISPQPWHFFLLSYFHMWHIYLPSCYPLPVNMCLLKVWQLTQSRWPVCPVKEEDIFEILHTWLHSLSFKTVRTKPNHQYQTPSLSARVLSKGGSVVDRLMFVYCSWFQKAFDAAVKIHCCLSKQIRQLAIIYFVWLWAKCKSWSATYLLIATQSLTAIPVEEEEMRSALARWTVATVQIIKLHVREEGDMVTTLQVRFNHPKTNPNTRII